MSPQSIDLETISIAAPCEVPWESMRGDHRVRFCNDCKLNVYNLSGMARHEAETLLNETEGRVCVRMLKRSDGTVVSEDCSTRLRAVGRSWGRLVSGAAALLSLFTLGGASGCLMPTQGAVDVIPRRPSSEPTAVAPNSDSASSSFPAAPTTLSSDSESERHK
jgi:hypothetical protein